MDLIEANEEDLKFLQQETKKFLPNSLTIFGLLDVGYQHGVVETSQTRLYIPRDRTLPLFIFAVEFGDTDFQNANCFWDEAKYSDDQIKKLLENVPNWNWTEPIFLAACSSSIIEKLEIFLLGSEGLTRGKTQNAYKNVGYAYHSSKFNNILDRFSKEDFIIDRIDPSKAEFIHSHWKYNFETSVNDLKRSMKRLPSAGAYHKQSDGKSQLVSWTVLRKHGEIGTTTSLPEYRNLGLATGVTKWLVNKCLEKKLLNYVLIADRDEESVRLHDKLGFKKEGRFGWQLYLPENGYQHLWKIQNKFAIKN